jgi:hypothetical protein
VTTHGLAGLLEHLREGLGAALKDAAARELTEAAAAFRELPDQSLKGLVKALQKLAAPADGAGSERLAERISACRAGRGESVDQVMKDISKLRQPALQALLRKLGQNPGKNKVAENKSLVRRLLETPADASQPPPAADEATARQVDAGYRLIQELRDAPTLSIEDLRARFAVVRQYPKVVLDEIARKLGYDFPGGKDEVANQLLLTLERMRISQMRGEVIRGSS